LTCISARLLLVAVIAASSAFFAAFYLSRFYRLSVFHWRG
jgi:hypothetical protein